MSAADADRLHDVHLWRALEHAPDQNVTPDWRLSRVILKHAHEEIGAPDPDEAEAELERAAQSWWPSLGSQGARRSRLPWKSAIAVLGVAAVVAVVWRREPAPPAPVPGPADQARIIAQPPRTAPAAPTPSPDVTAAIPVPPPSPPVAPASPAATPQPAAPQAAAPQATAPPAPSPPPAVALAPAPPPAVAVAPAPPPAAKPPKEPPAATPAPVPKREPAQAANPPMPSARPADAATRPPPTDAQAARPRKEEDTSAAQRQANAVKPPAAAPGGAAAAPPAPPASNVRTEATEPPTFNALSRWNRITITRRGGETRSLPRAEASDLNALLGSAALSAVGPQPLRSAPEWHVTLERNGEVLAVFDVTPSQVRWREGKTPPATGVPSAPALSALRAALGDAVQQPAAASPAPPPQRRTP
jgi:hypothetical protein